MKININQLKEKHLEQVTQLSKLNKIKIDNNGHTLLINESKNIALIKENNKVTFHIINQTDINYLFGLLMTKYHENDFQLILNKQSETLTYMLDASRNAVPKVETIKKLIDKLALFGYDAIQLYTEDTIEIENEPYFGYLRGRYTKNEIKEIDAYASIYGIELIGCIQTLAHFNSITRYHEYQNIFDVNDILLVDEEKTYEFIEKIIKTVKENFKSNQINIGMDEAYMIGRGRHLDKHGYEPKFDLMIRHLNKVLEICKKYDLKPMMWSDMFFALTLSNYYESMEQIPEELINQIPTDVILIYWDYYKTDKSIYKRMLEKHKAFKNEIYFAGGAWKWIGFTPDNRYSIEATKAAMQSCYETNIKNIIVTGWGDNGAEASSFSILPSLAYFGLTKFGKLEIDNDFKNQFKFIVGVSFDDYLKIDLANQLNDNLEDKNSSSKHYFYNDILLGLMDTTIESGYNDIYKTHLESIKSINLNDSEYKYIFLMQEKLIKVLSEKVEIGLKIRTAYINKDKNELSNLVIKLKIILEEIEDFYKAFYYQWQKENKPFGFDVQDLRIGGLKQRISSAIYKLESYIKGDLEVILELEEVLLDYYGKRNNHQKLKNQIEYAYQPIVTVNVNR